MSDATTPPESSTHAVVLVTVWTDTGYYLGRTFNSVMASLDMWLGLQAVVMNLLVMCFYLKSYKKIVPFMYLLIACCDCLTGCAAVLMSLIFLLLDNDKDTALALIPPAYGIFSVTFKVSVFLNLAISIVRTINIYLPFHRMRIQEVAIGTGVYTAGWAAYLVWEMVRWTSIHYTSLSNSVYSPGQYEPANNAGSFDNECRNIVLFIGLPYLLPSLIVVFCMILQLKTILKTRLDKTSSSKTQRNITITILMLTAVFFVCNTAYIAYPLTHCIRDDKETGILLPAEMRKRFMIRHVTGVLCPFINAAVNPVILVARGEALSKFLKRKLVSFSGSAASSVKSRRPTTYCSSIRNANFKPRPSSLLSISEIPLSSATPTLPTPREVPFCAASTSF